MGVRIPHDERSRAAKDPADDAARQSAGSVEDVRRLRSGPSDNVSGRDSGSGNDGARAVARISSAPINTVSGRTVGRMDNDLMRRPLARKALMSGAHLRRSGGSERQGQRRRSERRRETKSPGFHDTTSFGRRMRRQCVPLKRLRGPKRRKLGSTFS